MNASNQALERTAAPTRVHISYDQKSFQSRPRALSAAVAQLGLVRRDMLATILSTFGPWFFMAWGVLLVLKPNLFVRGHWKRTDIAQQLLSPKAYLVYTRCVGIFFIVAGLVWLFVQSAAEHRHRQTVGVATFASNQSMKPTAPLRCNFSVFATTPGFHPGTRLP